MQMKDPRLKPRMQEEIKTEGGPYNSASLFSSVFQFKKNICVTENGNNNETMSNRDMVTIGVKTTKYFIYFRSVKT